MSPCCQFFGCIQSVFFKLAFEVRRDVRTRALPLAFGAVFDRTPCYLGRLAWQWSPSLLHTCAVGSHHPSLCLLCVWNPSLLNLSKFQLPARPPVCHIPTSPPCLEKTPQTSLSQVVGRLSWLLSDSQPRITQQNHNLLEGQDES